MKQWTKGVAAVLILAACDAAPTTPEVPGSSAMRASLSPSLLLVLAPPQEVLIQLAEGGEETARFQAELFADADPDGAGRSKGFGFVEMWNSEGRLQIRVLEARADADGAVHFQGRATLWTDGERTEFPIAGSARPMCPSTTNPDCIIWDIFGGNVYDGATFEAKGRFLAVPASPPPLLLVLAPLQDVLIQRAERDSEPARFQAEIVLTGFDPGGHARAPAAAGAIRLESASDGQLQIRVQEARVDADGAVHFHGLAMLWTERAESVAKFPIAGSARPEPGNPDCIIWDIFGSNVYDGATFEAEGMLFTPGG
jgi:hypothetical protein